MGGHGTAVASIAAGDGTDSRGNIIRGSAYRAELIVVELKRVGDGNTGYTRTIDNGGDRLYTQKSDRIAKTNSHKLKLRHERGST